jgi:hypothetical protein
MRLWTVHPKYLDPQGLVALWREALLAQKVLAGKTKGYRFHPQLDRFKAKRNPRATVSRYLASVYDEACRRGYTFDKSKIGNLKGSSRFITEKRSALIFEWEHLQKKLRKRSPQLHRSHKKIKVPQAHPLFRIRKKL